MLPQTKVIVPVAQVSKTNGATAEGLIDTLGYDWATIDIITATADVVSNSPSVLKLQEADTTDATNLANISGFVGGTDFTIGPDSTSVANVRKFNVDLRGRKRYLNPVVSPRTTQLITIVANLGRAGESPINKTKAGVLALVEG